MLLDVLSMGEWLRKYDVFFKYGIKFVYIILFRMVFSFVILISSCVTFFEMCHQFVIMYQQENQT